MSPFKYGPVLAALLSAGCAATTQEVVEDTSAQASPGDTETEAKAFPEIEIAQTIELSPSDRDTSGRVICRDVRSLGSNVFRKRCMTREDWEKFEHLQMEQAQEVLRRMQGMW